ncbi:Uncharacterised protein [Mycobacteroides abscessus subsp. massiliense]|uniref:toxin glutamine deamidase domain-containing protein n=1 Tax=Mycobacteroides abscessus TaxID=36809 RepID=UPI000927DEBC|nr:toxin glutamine deamidase domain-containing protein [Mycobacteroides abscessus]SHR63983.1 Uncharacterised protein [Mycobacteroides abscessus subsp. abscessus]SKG48320.1 Uncharacterised protein [Mycobacteroides abscessus subsp. massiliense]SKG99748.1 Uncharacterised protein [Mycobacteroides abscessus subsp. massiliense]SKH98196.1 Uncharacterised protein [Mycobacteroides abscessus subsp. massiliense]SKJ27805.1 Uncharacterised protein [Mycobacteroides abscessus subsp. massiliense]
MSRPRKSDVYKANATALGDLATPLREAARTLRGSAQRVYTTVDDFDWLGQTRESAVGRAEREMTQNRVKADHLDALAEAYENGSKTMQPMIESLKTKSKGLEGNTFEVTENWEARDKYDYAAARKLAKMMDPDGSAGLQAQVDQLQAQRANEATTETGNLQKLADELGVADTNTDATIGKALAALGQTPTPVPTAQPVTFKQGDPPPTTPTSVDPATVDPKVLALLPGIDSGAAKPGTPAGSLPDLLAAASKAKPTLDPNAGSLTDKLLRIDPTMAARQSHVEKIPGIDPNSPAGQAGIAAVRNLAQAQGLTPAQVEAKVQDAIKTSSQDRYVTKFADPNAPSASPSEHVSRDFGEQFNRFTYGVSESATHTVDGQIEQAKILAGQGGPGQPTAAEAWKALGINAAHQVHELTTDPLAAPKIGIEQAKDFINSPSEFIGKNIIHGTEALATGAIGGEAVAAGRGLLGDLTATEGRALTHELTDGTHVQPSAGEHHVPTGGDHGSVGGDRFGPGDHVPSSGDHPVVPAPDGLDHHMSIGPQLPESIQDIQKWLPEVNHGPGMDVFDPARAVNCGQCALAVDQRLTGALPDASAGLGTLSIPEMEAATGLRQVPATPSQIEQHLIDQGPGAHTVIGVDRGNGFAGHWFNAYYDGAKVYAVDGQTGQVVGWPPHMDVPGGPVTNWDMGVPK